MGSLSGGVETALGRENIPTRLKVMQGIVELEDEKIQGKSRPTSLSVVEMGATLRSPIWICSRSTTGELHQLKGGGKA